MTDDASPIFIMSSERSGSNLLRVLLSNHSDIAGAVPPQFIPRFHGLVPYYGPLSERPNAYRLMEDMLAIANHPYYAWNLSVEFDDVYHRYAPKVFLDFFNLFYREKCVVENKRRFVCKENRIFDFAFPLLQYYEQPKFIYLYRDPRDYVVSIMRILFGPKTPYAAAKLWVQEQQKCKVLINTFLLPVHHIKYETLVSDPAAVMKDLLLFLEEPVEESCFQVQPNKNEDVTWNVAWKNLTKPIMQSNFGKYKNQFDTKTINVIETVAKELMMRLGYDFDTSADWQMPRFFRYRNALANRLSVRKARASHAETASVLFDLNNLIRIITQKRKEEWMSAGSIAIK